MPDEPLTCSANTSPASAATLSPSASPPCSDKPRERTTTSRTYPASFPAATQPHGHAHHDRRPASSDNPAPEAETPTGYAHHTKGSGHENTSDRFCQRSAATCRSPKDRRGGGSAVPLIHGHLLHR